MIKFLVIAGALICGIAIYLLGNLIIGKKRKGGMRALAFVFGVCSTLLGGGLCKEMHENLYLVILGGIFVLFGIYLLIESLFASNQRIGKIVEHFLDGI